MAVIGGGAPPPGDLDAAFTVGRRLAALGATVVCGGLGGVMEAACRGARSAGGLTVGLVPGSSPADANRWVDVVIPTGLGEMRNALVVASAAAVVAVGGEYGTLSEIALALRSGKPVVGYRTWSLTRPAGGPDGGITVVDDPASAAELAVALATGGRG